MTEIPCTRREFLESSGGGAFTVGLSGAAVQTGTATTAAQETGGPEFEITAQSATEAVVPGGTTRIFLSIYNTGDATGDPSAYFQAATGDAPHNADYYGDEFSVVSHNDDGGDWQYEGWAWNAVGPGEGREPSVELSVSESVDPGEYTFAIDLFGGGSDDSAATATVTVAGTDTSPTAAFTVTPDDPVVGDELTFDASESRDPDGSIVLYQWDVGGTGQYNASLGREFTATGDNPGETTVILRVVDNDGNTDTTSKTIVVEEQNTPPTAAFTITPDEPSTDDELTLDASASTDSDGNIETYEWRIGSGSEFTPAGVEYTETVSEAGDTTITLRVTDDDGATDTASQTVTIVESNTPPTAQFTISPENPSRGDTVTFDASASMDPDSDDEIVAYEWTLDGLSDEEGTPTGRVLEQTAANAGDFEVQLRVTDTEGATDTTTEAVSVAHDFAAGSEPIADLLQQHIDERRTAVLEEGYDAADVLDGQLIDVTAEDAAVTGAEAATAMLDDIVVAAADEASDGNVTADAAGGAARGILIDLGIDVGFNALANVQMAHMLGRLNEQTPADAAERYERYVNDLETVPNNWFNQPYRYDPDDARVSHRDLQTYQNAVETADRLPDRIAALEDAPESLNRDHVAAVLEQLEETLSDPAGIGTLDRQSAYPTDLVILPDGTVRNTQRGAAHLPSLRGAAEEYEDKNLFDWLGGGMKIVGLAVGIGLIVVGAAKVVIPEPSSSVVGAVVVLKGATKVVGVASAMTSIGASVEDMSDRQRVLQWYMDLYLDTLHDIDSLGMVSEDIENWLAAQYDEPTTGTVDGTLFFDSTAFQDQPLSLTDSPAEDGATELSVGEVPVGWENTGEEVVPGRVLGFSAYYDERPDTGSEFPRLQGFATTYPAPNEQPQSFAPDITRAERIDYQFHQPVDDPFRQHFYSAHLVLAGRHVSKTTEAVRVETADDSGFFFAPRGVPAGRHASQLSSAGVRSARLRPYTTAETPADRTMTRAEMDELRGETATVLDTTLDSGESARATVSLSGDLSSSSTVLFVPPGAEATLLLRDESGNAVGPDSPDGEFAFERDVLDLQGGAQVTVRPDETATVTAEVRVPEEHDSPVPVTVFEIRVPERPPVLGTKPTQLSLFGTLGERLDQRFTVTEVGNQQSVTELRVDPESLVNDDGTTLPADALSGAETASTVDPGSNETASVTVEAPESLDLSGESTRFTGDVLVDSGNAGTHILPVSLLLIDTDIEGIQLLNADTSVERVAATETELSDDAPSPPGEVQAVYELTVAETGSATLRVDELLPSVDADERMPMRLVNGTYEPIDPADGVRVGHLEFDAGEHTIVVTDQSAENTDDSDPDNDQNKETGESATDTETGSSSGDGSGPGFGIGSTLASLGGVGYLLKRRLSTGESADEEPERAEDG